MAEWLLELFSEEIPARMQAGAARDLERRASEGLDKAGLSAGSLRAFSGPRRLTLVADGLPTAQADRIEERKGPRLGAPDAALAGFLRGAGVSREDLIERDGAYLALIPIAGRATVDILAELVPDIVRRFPWPKSMVWGAGKLRWVRPLHRILCVFDRQVTAFSIDGVVSGDTSEGHRVMAAGRAFSVLDFDAYQAALESHFVVLDVAERKRRILEAATTLAAARGLDLVADPGLLDEVAGMVEWPVPVVGDMDARFMALPPEVIRTTMRTHQRYFALRTNDRLAPHFIAVANLETDDGGALIAKGNSRVLAARLDDARFFWEEDQKVPLETRLSALAGVTFHAKIGTMLERAHRLERLSRAIAPLVGADPDQAALAGRLAKADLVTAMVGEFPDLQGVIGAYYGALEGLPAPVTEAIRDHYRPQGPGDAAPTAPTAVAVSLADKIDTIVAFFTVGEKPTGSRDPFALRRAALGCLRILQENALAIGYRQLAALATEGNSIPEGLDAFFAERLKVSLRELGHAPEQVDAVFAIGDDEPVRVAARLTALSSFLDTDSGATLLAGYRRAINILNAEEKKGALPRADAVSPSPPPEEAALHAALTALRPRLDAALNRADFEAALMALAELRSPVDRFFDKVLVNSEDEAERAGRLALLGRVRQAMGEVADFAAIPG